ncbi:hypothetical protein PG2072B_0971 [Bifidobacterium pseudolongum subsp. globosum]|uniref:Uncharacterized protein n=1 Tax=Bifidobacterium pseudolongum subsp. globosum TaxID=1690 RepID=A0A4Q5B2S3_9BIFI|nr:hypothetical protein PG2000B_1051 [Bifidobacterium pseudolongum subsp. globosum]RYQ68368.1 hypothetical protein PG2072B_0971 [Bifidobacterium pseudolongum subsp. globosum]
MAMRLPRFIVLSLTCGATIVCLGVAALAVMAGVTTWKEMDHAEALSQR